MNKATQQNQMQGIGAFPLLSSQKGSNLRSKNLKITPVELISMTKSPNFRFFFLRTSD